MTELGDGRVTKSDERVEREGCMVMVARRCCGLEIQLEKIETNGSGGRYNYKS